MTNAKPLVTFLVKLLVSAGLLGFFFTQIHFEHFWDTLASADLYYIALAAAVYLVTQAISALRWAILSRPLGFTSTMTNIVVYYLIGMFFNLFAPSTVGGDLCRIYYLSRDAGMDSGEGGPRSTLPAAVSVLMDRAVGMIVLLWLGAIGLVLFPKYAVPWSIRVTTLGLSLAFILAVLLLPVLRRVLPNDGHSLVVKLRLAVRSYRTRWQAVPQATALSFVIHLIQAWMHVVLGWAIGLDIPFSYCIIVYPLVGVFAAIPVSFNGIGLREGGYMFMLGVIGVSSAQGVAFGLLLFAVVTFDSLLGGVAFLLKKGAKPAAVTVSDSGF